MEHVMKAIDEWRERIEEHPLHTWLIAQDDGIAPEQKLWFSLYFTNFIMYFRELNLYHISYGEDRRLDRQRESISVHADEDMTHARLFLRDFKLLGWDRRVGFRPSEVFHWLFSSEVNEDLRRRTTAIAKLVISAEAPVVRYAVVEAIEACGNALFRHTADVASRYEARTGKELIYWGAFHLARETGHAVDDDAFEGVVLTDAQRKAAIRSAVRVFELIDEQNSDMLRLAQETISQGGFASQRERHAAPPTKVDFIDGPNTLDDSLAPSDLHPSQRPIQDALDRCTDTLRSSGLVEHFASDDLDEGLARLRMALLFLATDTLGSVTLYCHMVSYPFPKNPSERKINRMARQFGGRAETGPGRRSLFYVDWSSLGLDEVLAWPASRTLEFIYLDQATDAWRRLRAVATHHIDVTEDPLRRYWTIRTLKSLNGVQASAMERLARSVERRIEKPLPYLTLKLSAQRPNLEPDPEATAVRFETFALSPSAAEQVVLLVEEIGRAFQARSAAMIEAVRRGAYPMAALRPAAPRTRRRRRSQGDRRRVLLRWPAKLEAAWCKLTEQDHAT